MNSGLELSPSWNDELMLTVARICQRTYQMTWVSGFHVVSYLCLVLADLLHFVRPHDRGEYLEHCNVPLSLTNFYRLKTRNKRSCIYIGCTTCSRSLIVRTAFSEPPDMVLTFPISIASLRPANANPMTQTNGRKSNKRARQKAAKAAAVESASDEESSLLECSSEDEEPE